MASSKSRRADPAATTDRKARFWEKYSEEASEYDKSFLKKNRDSLTAVMLFAGLFSAVAASFLVTVQGSLQPNPTDTTNALLMMLIHSIDNTTFTDQNLGLPVWTGPSPAIICSQSLGYAALSASLLAALGAVLATQWLSDFIRIRSGLLQERCRRHQQKLDGLETWKFNIFTEALPALIQLALLLFSISLAIYLWELNHTVGSVLFAATAVGVSCYLYITLASLLSPKCPYHTPISSAIHLAIETVMRSAEEVTGYWIWRSDRDHEKRPVVHSMNRILAHVIAILFPPLLSTFRSSADKSPRSNRVIRWLHGSACRVRESVRGTYPDPQPKPGDSDPRAIVWLLQRTKDRDSLLAASELVLDVEWPEDLDTSLATEHVYSSFIRSAPDLISKSGSTSNQEVLLLGKALIYMLCQVSKEASSHVWKTALRRVGETLKNVKPEEKPDVSFILTILEKLLSIKQGLPYPVTEFPTTCCIPPSLLAWLLQPLEILLRSELPAQSRSLPEAHRAFLQLEFPNEPMSRTVFCRTFEIYFNSVICKNCTEIDRNQRHQHVPEQLQIDCLNRIFQRLKGITHLDLLFVHHDLLVPLKVLSRLAVVPYLQQVFRDAILNPWMIESFKVAVGATQAAVSGEKMWPFASHIMDLARVLDSFSPIYAPIRRPSTFGFQLIHGQTPTLPRPSRMDSETLLSYLLNKESPEVVTSQQILYGMQIVLYNTEDLLDLASNPNFLDYIKSFMHTNAPKQDVREAGLKVLIAACQKLYEHLHRTQSNPQRLAELMTEHDIVQLLRDAILGDEPWAILESLVRNNDQSFKSGLLTILKPDLGENPFDAILAKLDEEPNDVPLRELRLLDVTLVLSTKTERQELLYDRLDGAIAQINDFNDPLALPLAIIVGWRLRVDGPLVAAGDVWNTFYQVDVVDLLTAAWNDPKRLGANPLMLALLLTCTWKWFSLNVKYRTELSGSPSVADLKRLRSALERMREESSELPPRINAELAQLATGIKKYFERSE